MALSTYAGLQAAVLAWAERTGDSTASDKLADCVVLVESRLNNLPDFRVLEMEDDETLTLSSGSANLPSNFLSVKRVTANTDPTQVLEYAEPGWFQEAYPSTATDDDCKFYTVVGNGGTLTLRSKSSATLELVYFEKIPALASNDPNWLLTKAPNVYLYGTLLELALALGHDEADRWGALFTSAVNTLISAEGFRKGASLARRAQDHAP